MGYIRDYCLINAFSISVAMSGRATILSLRALQRVFQFGSCPLPLSHADSMAFVRLLMVAFSFSITFNSGTLMPNAMVMCGCIVVWVCSSALSVGWLVKGGSAGESTRSVTLSQGWVESVLHEAAAFVWVVECDAGSFWWGTLMIIAGFPLLTASKGKEQSIVSILV